MATVQAGANPISLDSNELDLGIIATGGPTPGGQFLEAPKVGSATANHLQLTYHVLGGGGGTYAWNFDGSGLTYFPAHPPAGFAAPDITGGTLTHMADHANKAFGIDISGFAVPAATFWSQLKAGDNLAVLSSILAGNDTIIGSNQRTDPVGQPVGDHLLGYTGDDNFNAGAGFDHLRGGPGNDFLNGGTDTDTAQYSGLASAYKIVTYAGVTGVIANSATSAEGTDKLVNVEQIAFADQTIATPGDNFSPLDYIASYADLRAALGTNAAAGFDHYLFAGASEGRTVTFDGLEYIASYADLRSAFGANDAAGASHFITNGASEGRQVTFDGLDYIASYKDLIESFHNQIAANPSDDIGTIHFISAGHTEGRTVTFNPVAYELANPDVAAVFGDNLDAATQHYITTGYFEGRAIA